MTQWTLTIPDEMDRSVRTYLQLHGNPSDLSDFVQKAVSSEILRGTIREIQDDNKDLTAEEAQALAVAVEAVAWARAGNTI